MKALEGNAGKRKARQPEFGDLPDMPPSLPKRAQPTWDYLVPMLADRVALHRIDAIALADLVLCVFRLNQCERLIESKGVLVPGDKGKNHKVKNPAAQLAREYRQSVQRWFSVFGLTPADRERVPAVGAQNADPIEAAREKLRSQSVAVQ